MMRLLRKFGIFLATLAGIGIWLFSAAGDKQPDRVSLDKTPILSERTQINNPHPEMNWNAYSAATSAKPVTRTTKKLLPLPPRVIDYINTEYANSAVTRRALIQLANGWNEAIHDMNNASDAKAAGVHIAQGIACALNNDVLKKNGVSQQVMYDRIKSTRAVMLNSDAATRAYIHFQGLANGQFFEDSGYQPCNFDPEQAPN